MRPAYPYHMVLIITEHCNLNCIHCSTASSKYTKRVMTYEQVIDVLNQLAKAGIVDVAFSGGEPLLHPHIFELIQYARKTGFQTGLSSNGYPVTQKTIQRLKNVGLNRLQISLDGLKQEHDHMRGSGAFEYASTAILSSLGNGLTTNVCFTATRENQHCFADTIDYVAGLGINGFNLSKLVPTGRGDIEKVLSSTETEKLFGTFIDKKKQYPDIKFTSHLAGLCLYDDTSVKASGFIGCQAGIYIGCVKVSGDITPCVLFSKNIGNLFERPFKEIWQNSSTIHSLKERELGGICGHCDKKDVCGGCRAVAYAQTGDFLGEDATCSHII